MGRTTSTTSTTLDAEALQAAIAAGVAKALADLDVPLSAPESTTIEAEKAEKAAAQQAHKEEFFSAIHDPQTKADNSALAAWCREKGLVPNGRVWKLVKDGCADMRKLKTAAKQDDADRAARKAAKQAQKSGQKTA